nr:ComEC/Rec2 family competence protein [Chitinophaga sp. SYP-B3965]
MYLTVPVGVLFLLFSICITGWVIPPFLKLSTHFALRHVQGVCIHAAICLFGIGLFYQSDIRHKTNWMGHHLKDCSQLIVSLTEQPIKKAKSWKAEARVLAIMNSGQAQPVTGKILLYFRKESNLRYGNRLIIEGEIQKIRGDYGKYCGRKNLFHQVFLKNWQTLPGGKSQNWLITTREYCLKTLRRYIPRQQEYGIAQALLIGYREELDKDIVQAYTNTGVVHIIAISGLHLGLIYITLLQMLKWLPKKRWAEISKALLVIFVLWAFSLLTGASASVLRSAVMFTTIAIGQFMLARYSNIYNTLAAAAFMLLSYHPYFLLDVGFQLSFLAVGGILLCYQPIYDWWLIKHKWLDKLWQMIAVSLAAQIFTWPVCLYYFHQFPNFFLLANLVAVPLSTILLYGEIILVAIPNLWLGKLLTWGIMGMNTWIQWLDKIPGAVTNNIQISLQQTICLYGITIALLLKRGMGALTIGVLFAGLHAYDNMQKKIIIYNGTVACIYGRQKKEHKTETLIQFEGKRILRLTGRLPNKPPAKRIKIDYILLSHNPRVDISRLHDYFIYELIIFDDSNAPFLIRKWKSACKKLPLRFFSVPDEGAFVVNL